MNIGAQGDDENQTVDEIPTARYLRGMATPGALANISADSLIEHLYNGAIPAQLATALGVHKCSVYRHLADHPEYKTARKAGMAVRLDEAEMAVISADERTLPRAREVWRCVTWRAEREHPEAWGNAQRVMGADGGPLQVEIVRYSAPVTLDAAPQQKSVSVK